MKNYQNILFDLDGTLIDSKEGIVNSVKYALSYFGISNQKEEDLYKFLGPPLRESFSQYYNFNEENTELAVLKYREYFKEEGVFQNVLYDGIEELLKDLVQSNKNLIIATSKAEIYAKQIIERLGISEYFSFVCGSTFNGSLSKKTDIIQYILQSNHLLNNNCIMVGDKLHDIIGAKNSQIDSIGVLYGYGTYKELEEAGATYIVKNVKELQKKLKETNYI